MSVIDEIVNNLDIVDYISRYTRLKKSGNSYRGLCPLHNGDNSNSLAVFPDTNTFYCFSCGKGGSLVDFVSEQNNITYIEAIELLAKEANIDIKVDERYQREKTMYESNQNIALRCYNKLDTIIDWLTEERGLTKETIDSFFLGYDNKNNDKSVVIPLHDSHGRIVAFCKRYINKKPKYINSPNNELYTKSEFLFNSYRARQMLQNYQRLYICEGYMDAMSAYQQGLACVAYCGSELTKEQINQVRSMVKHTKNIVIMYAPDNDEVGQEKIQRVWEKFNELAPNLDVRVVRFPDTCKDFNDVLTSGLSIIELQSEPIALTAIKIALDSCFDKQQEFGVASEKIRYVRNPLIKQEIIEYLANRWNKPITDVKEITNIDFTDSEMVNDFKDVTSCFTDYLDLINTEGSGIGFETIDNVISLRPTDVVFWAGYSGTYKTMVACEVALYNAIKLKKNVLFFSMEMSSGALYERLIARVLQKSTREIEEMAKDGQQAKMLSIIKEKIQEHIYVIDKSSLTIKDIEKYIIIANNRIIKNGQVDYVILDYFQYLNMEGYEETAMSAKYTKVIAKNHNVVFFILSQLNRTGDNYSRPTIKMLKGSGDLEASADYILLSYRPEFDNKLKLDMALKLKDIVKVIIGKARRGVKQNITEFTLKYHSEEGRLRDLGVNNE